MTLRPRVVLYNPQNGSPPKPIMPFSVLALAARMNDVADWVLVDGNLESDPLRAVDRAIRETGANVLAVTVMPGPQLKRAVPHSRQIKEQHPDLDIVWGGYFPTQHWDVALRAPYVDVVVRGHGEETFRQILLRKAAGEEWRSLAGVAFRNPDSGEPVSNPLAPVPHPDRLPDYPYERIELRRYARNSVLGRRTLSHHSSYGCPFKCNFCAVVNMVDGRWLAQSAERVERIVRYYVHTANIDAVEFFDNNFFVHQARTVEFSERIADLGLAWWGEGRIDTLLRYRDETWRSMARAGLKMVFMGAESGSDETLRRMDKGGTMSADKTLEIAELFARYGIVPEFSFVLGSPPDPERDVLETIEFIKKVKKVNPKSEIIMYMYTPVPLAGELYDNARATGFAFPRTLEEWCNPSWEAFSLRRSASMPWVTRDLRRHVRNFERVLNAYYPTSTFPHLRGVRSAVLRTVSRWRWATGRYEFPYELQLLHRAFHYQRPETTGF
ncbi:MAG TPA: radical SAM protein [Chloroflexota bacterium]|nr:radical SAM protein [Chloroflexota bacterium]